MRRNPQVHSDEAKKAVRDIRRATGGMFLLWTR